MTHAKLQPSSFIALEKIVILHTTTMIKWIAVLSAAEAARMTMLRLVWLVVMFAEAASTD